MARKKKEMGSGGNWMDTYGDMVTLLFTFFVCLYSMASMSDEKWYELVKAFNVKGSEQVDEIVFAVTEQEGKAVHATMQSNDLEGSNQSNKGDMNSENIIFQNLYNYLKEYIENTPFGEMILIEQAVPEDYNENEAEEQIAMPIFLQLNNTLLFEPDRSELLAESYDPLNAIADAILKYQGDIGQVVIKGYTADIESDADAVHLSSERSLEVLDFLRFIKDFPEEKLVSTGLGKNFPIAENDTEENRAMNRRVEIVIIPKSISDNNFLSGSYFSTTDQSNPLTN